MDGGIMNEPVPESKFNPAQKEALIRCYDDLSEKFDNVLIVVSSDTGDNDVRYTCRLFYSGGFIGAVGLATLAKRDLLANMGEPIK